MLSPCLKRASRWCMITFIPWPCNRPLYVAATEYSDWTWRAQHMGLKTCIPSVELIIRRTLVRATPKSLARATRNDTKTSTLGFFPSTHCPHRSTMLLAADFPICTASFPTSPSILRRVSLVTDSACRGRDPRLLMAGARLRGRHLRDAVPRLLGGRLIEVAPHGGRARRGRACGPRGAVRVGLGHRARTWCGRWV